LGGSRGYMPLTIANMAPGLSLLPAGPSSAFPGCRHAVTSAMVGNGPILLQKFWCLGPIFFRAVEAPFEKTCGGPLKGALRQPGTLLAAWRGTRTEPSHRAGSYANFSTLQFFDFCNKIGHFRTNAVRRTLLQRGPGSLTTFAAIRSLPERVRGRAP
jgi:hypothetical protein